VRKSDPDYVSGRKGRYELQPPIVHPPFCVCAMCPVHRVRAAEKNGRSVEELWSESIVIRARRRSPSPESRVESAAAALNFKRDEEARLVQAVAAAEQAGRARANAISFGKVADAYRRYLIDEGKRYDRARSLIDNIEALIGRHRDVETVDITVYRELLAEVAQLAPETRRHYAATLLAMLNFAKAERIIVMHKLDDVRLPKVVKNDAPVTWTKKEFAILMGPALDEYEREQARWNANVGNVEGTGSLRAPSHVPLRGMMLIAYYTLMRPKNNRALTWEEITLDPEKGSGRFQLDQHKNVNKGIRAWGPLARPLVDYLWSIRPTNASGVVHRNPATGGPYVDIRKQWSRLVAIASRMLGYELQDEKADFFTFRHTGASHIAERARDARALMLVVNMMGDTNVETVRRHYFNFDHEVMAGMIEGWEIPDVASPNESASAELTLN